MQKTAAQKLVQETLQGSFNKERFVYLVKNILNHVEEDTFTYKGNFIFDDFRDSIRLVDRIGKYKGPDEKLIDILIVHLQRETSLERARTKQRNFVAKYLKGSRGGVLKDAALVAFVAPNGNDWRFSLVKMEYKFNEKGKVEEEFTPARRHSFLVGKNENSHTAQSRLLPVLLNDEANPTLEELEEVFSVERVTKEFFEKYRDIFLRLKESLDDIVKQDAKVKADFKAKNIDTIDFGKKLLGQIVFLYFLQKKGWFGVKRDEAWGAGSKNFLRELYEKQHGNYQNFFNDIVEPLFYEALRLERSGDYYSRFNCRIPFLNGGLFDPINNYDWWNTDILLPDDIFSNSRKTKEGDIGNGILDIFDRYNFTVKEDEPLEKEVAIDPEMLGKVFENLLEVKDRKSKGTYYTPREIVHYMCQESLENYLATELEGKTSKEEIETLIKYGEMVVEHDSRVVNKGRETGRYAFKLPQSIRQYAKLIDEKLASIRVCDPAVGSGAFPVGMMNEIIRTRNALTPYIDIKSSTGISACDNTYTPQTFVAQTGMSVPQMSVLRSLYHFKRQAIQNCLYGVDIDPGAIEIAKLRLWLSLVVDEEERETIQPLPNLDYKIVQGNSLLSVEKDLFNAALFSKLEELKPLYFNETSASKKQEYRKQIDELISQITNGHKDFDFEVYFSEVFHEKKGFDVVIANPPYVRQEQLKELKPALKVAGYECFNGTADLLVYFYERSVKILRSGGAMALITSNKYYRAGYGEKLRGFLVRELTLNRLIDFGDTPVFEAIAYASILTGVKTAPPRDASTIGYTWDKGVTFDHITQIVAERGQKIAQGALKPEGWQLESPAVLRLLEKLHRTGKPLGEYVSGRFYYGIKTGLNEAFVVDRATRDRLIREHESSAEVLKPFLRGRDVKRWRVEYADHYLIKIESSENVRHPWSGKSVREVEKIFARTYPAIHARFETFRAGLIKRYDQGKYFWELRSCAYWKEFEKPGVIYPELAFDPQYAWSESGWISDCTLYVIPDEGKCLTAVMNSSVVRFFFHQISPKVRGGYMRFKALYMRQIPIPSASAANQSAIADLVDHILAAKRDDPDADVSALEREIDQLMYKLYGLTAEEIQIVEQSTPG